MPDDHPRRGRPKGSGLDDREQLIAIARMLEADPTLKPTTAIKRVGITDPSAIRRLRDKLRGEYYTRIDGEDAGEAQGAKEQPAVSVIAAPPQLRSLAGPRPADAKALTVDRDAVADPNLQEGMGCASRGRDALTVALAPAKSGHVVDELVARVPSYQSGAGTESGPLRASVMPLAVPSAGVVEGQSISNSVAQSSQAGAAAATLAAQWYALGLHVFAMTVEAQTAAMQVVLKSPVVASAVKQQVMFNEVAKAFCPAGRRVRKGSPRKSQK